jgi:hypothetical protein
MGHMDRSFLNRELSQRCLPLLIRTMGQQGRLLLNSKLSNREPRWLKRVLGHVDRSLPKRGLSNRERLWPRSAARWDKRRERSIAHGSFDGWSQPCRHESPINSPHTEFAHRTQKALAQRPGRREEVCGLRQSTERCQLPYEVLQGFFRAW